MSNALEMTAARSQLSDSLFGELYQSQVELVLDMILEAAAGLHDMEKIPIKLSRYFGEGKYKCTIYISKVWHAICRILP